MGLPLLSVRTRTHITAERLSAWELYAVFKQIIKGKVSRSCEGHFSGYSSECVYSPGREGAQSGGGGGPPLFNVALPTEHQPHSQAAYQK